MNFAASAALTPMKDKVTSMGAAAVGLTPMQAKVTSMGFKVIWRKIQPVVVTSICLVASVKLYYVIQRKIRRYRWAKLDKDKVLLHSFPRGKYCPSVSPFVLKLETYLRMSSIPYEIEYTEPMGSKGKCPWITLGGKHYTDSQFIIEMLGTKYEKNFMESLSDEQKAVAHTFQIMADEHLYWCWVYFIYKTTNGNLVFFIQQFPFFFKFIFPMVKSRIIKQLDTQGIGLHNSHEVKTLVEKNLSSISAYLGDKPYLMGDNMCEVDCAVFGVLAQIKWNSLERSPYYLLIKEKYENLFNYCDRIKSELWPDWNMCLDHGIDFKEEWK